MKPGRLGYEILTGMLLVPVGDISGTLLEGRTPTWGQVLVLAVFGGMLGAARALINRWWRRR